MKTRKLRLLSFVLAVAMMFAVMPVSAFAADNVTSGPCGDDSTWALTEDNNGDYTLTISGTGAMQDYSEAVAAPWSWAKHRIRAIAIGDEITADTIKLLLKSKKSAGNAMHRNLMRMFWLYMLVGGMPQAVEAYLEHNNPKGDKINPIEVKSGNYRGHKSLDVFCDKYSSRIRDKYVVHTKDYKWENGIHYLPVYMIPFL